MPLCSQNWSVSTKYLARIVPMKIFLEIGTLYTNTLFAYNYDANKCKSSLRQVVITNT